VRRAREHTVKALGARLQSLPVGQLETLQRSLAALSEQVTGGRARATLERSPRT
jgi:hypothetical protein